MVWSHSALKDYENCARKYHEVRVLKKYKQEDTEQTLYGKELHAAAELYVKEGQEFPKKFEFMKPIVDALLKKPGAKHAELQLAVDEQLMPCDWKSPRAWVRGIIDLLILDEKKAWVVDYKTGSNKYPDVDQLTLMSLLIFAHYPHIAEVQSALVFVVKEGFVKSSMQRVDAEKHWWKYRERVGKIEASHTHSVWNPKPSGLCPWCPVTSCEQHPKH